jgi:hypothetical protein
LGDVAHGQTSAAKLCHRGRGSTVCLVAELSHSLTKLQGLEGLVGHLDVGQVRGDVHPEVVTIDVEDQRDGLTDHRICLVETARLRGDTNSSVWAAAASRSCWMRSRRFMSVSVGALCRQVQSIN